jgi:hypothetical protein
VHEHELDLRLRYPAFVGHAFVDVAWMAYREGDQAVRHPAATVGLTLVALALGLGIALIDASPGWDDTGVSAAALFAVCALLGGVGPRQPWMWAMAVGLWIPMLAVALHPSAPNYGSVLALVVAVVGAYAGAGVRRVLVGVDNGP